MKQILKYLAIFFMIGTIITVSALYFIDDYIYSLNNTNIYNVATKKSELSVTKTSNIVLPEGVNDVEYSYDNKYYTYLLDGVVYINSLTDGTNVSKIEEKSKICYYKLLYDKNLIIYFVEDKTNTTSKISLKRYSIDSKQSDEFNKFTIQNFSKIKSLEMSPVINIIYFNVETKKGNVKTDTLYRADLFNNMSKVTSNYIIDKLVMLQHKDKLYFEDKDGNVYYSNSKLNLFKEKVDIIGIDKDDSIYFISRTTKSKVYKVQNNSIVDTIELKDNKVISTYSNMEGIYLIYDNYVINLINNKDQKAGRLSKYVKFDAIKSDIMYFRISDNIILKSKLNIAS